MKVLETVLHFLTVLARIIFPRKQKKAADSCPCPDPFPAPSPPLSPDAGNGSHPGLHRRDTVALNNNINATGCLLMLTGAAGCLLKWVAG